MNMNDNLSKSQSYKYILLLALLFISILLFFIRIKPLIKEVSFLEDEIKAGKELRLNQENFEVEDREEISFDNKEYDNYYNQLVDFVKENDIDYLELKNSYVPIIQKSNLYPMITETELELENLDDLYKLRPIIMNKLIDFNIFGDEGKTVTFKNFFIFDKSYSQKDLLIDNRENQISSFESDDINESDKADEDIKNSEQAAFNNVINEDTIKKQIFNILNFQDDNIKLLNIPMKESISCEGKFQLSPTENKKSYLVNLYNSSDDNGSALILFKDKSIKLFTGDVDVILKCDIYDKGHKNIEINLTDYYGENFYERGNVKDDKVIFNISDDYNFPIEISGVKFDIPGKGSISYSLKNITLEAREDLLNDIENNGILRTLAKDNEKSVDEFISKISNSILKEEFLSDNQISENDFNNKKVYLIRFRNLYEIRW